MHLSIIFLRQLWTYWENGCVHCIEPEWARRWVKYDSFTDHHLLQAHFFYSAWNNYENNSSDIVLSFHLDCISICHEMVVLWFFISARSCVPHTRVFRMPVVFAYFWITLQPDLSVLVILLEKMVQNNMRWRHAVSSLAWFWIPRPIKR